MSRLQTLFTEHPQKVGETYFEHSLVAGSFGLLFLKLAGMSFVHAVFPWCFERAASDRIELLHDELCLKRAHTIAPTKVLTE